MPELPEVETIVRQLRPLLIGRRVVEFDVFDPLLGLKKPERLADRRVRSLFRSGKQIVMELGTGGGAKQPLWIAIHLRMTGRLLWREPGEAIGARKNGARKKPAVAPLRAVWRLDRGAVVFHDTRRFGTIRVLERVEQTESKGLDPTSTAFDARALAVLIGGARTPIKPWLLRQDKLVGIGNIYASEVLFEAGIHPARPAESLRPAEIASLREAIRAVLERAIAAGGTTFSDFQNARGDVGNYQKNLRVYDHEGDPCPQCARPIARIVQQQRATYYCDRCQPERKRNAKPIRE
jgi:formamidopyrimidine-DNA glycosylase